MWAYGFAKIGDADNVIMGTTIEEFFERISTVNSNCYFFNLQFDGSFILDWLMKNGFTHTTFKQAREGEFKTLINDMGKFYSITVNWMNGRVTEFRDAAKKFAAGMSIAGLAKVYQLGESKGEIDYHAERPIGHELTDEEREYLTHDVSILAKAMNMVLSSGMNKLTIGSDALAEYKRLVGSKGFARIFPTFSDHMDAEIRRAYRGGFTYADPRFTGRVTGAGLVLDVNSLYPSVMRYRPIPYGEPEFVSGKVEPTANRPLTIFSVTFVAKLKPNHIPCIQIKGTSMFSPTEYLTEIVEPTTLMVTNVDWDLYNDHYDITVLERGGGWRFNATEGLFNNYIDKWAHVKETSSGGARDIAKLFLNSLYGKFATNPNVTSKYPVLENDQIRLVLGEDETRPPVYTAAGVFITSYARDLTIRSAQQNYDTFAYADTDSLHLLQDTIPDTIDVHPSKMGAWKLEYHFEAAYYVRPKMYFERMADGTYHNAIAGVPTKVSKALKFEDLIDQRVLTGKLRPKRVPGGIVLEEVGFTLKL